MPLFFAILAAGVLNAGVDAAPSSTKTPPPADVSIGGEVVMRLRSTVGGLTPVDRAAKIEDRLTQVVAIPKLTPADVVLYTPAGKPPVIYVVGRKLITVDDATAAGAGGKPIEVATKWAKRLQQILPLVDIRLRNEPEPVIPPDPPLTIATEFDQVGGQVGEVTLRDKLVMRLRGPQPHGLTPAERADQIGEQIAVAVHNAPNLTPDDIKAVQYPGPISAASVMVGTRKVVDVDLDEAKAEGVHSPAVLARSWAKNIRNVVFPPQKPPPPLASTPPSTVPPQPTSN